MKKNPNETKSPNPAQKVVLEQIRQQYSPAERVTYYANAMLNLINTCPHTSRHKKDEAYFFYLKIKKELSV